MLEFGHELAVETAHGVAREETIAPLGEVLIDVAQLLQERTSRRFVFLGERQLEFAVKVLNDGRGLLVLHEEIMSARNVLHYVSLDLFILEDSLAVVDQDWRRRRIEVRSEIRRGTEHVHSGYLEARRALLQQELQLESGGGIPVCKMNDGGNVTPFQFATWDCNPSRFEVIDPN